MERNFTIKPSNNPIEVKVETNNMVPELTKSSNVYSKVAMYWAIASLIIVPIINILSGFIKPLSAISNKIFLGTIIYAILSFIIIMKLGHKMAPLGIDPINRINKLQKELENSEQFPANIFKKFDANEFKNWDKDYILIKTEIDDKKKTVNMNVYVPYNSLVLLP